MTAASSQAAGHAEMEELAAGFALDALEPEEEGVFLQHFSTCSRCQAAVEDFQAVAGDLALLAASVEDMPVPPALVELFAAQPRGLPADPFVPAQGSPSTSQAWTARHGRHSASGARPIDNPRRGTPLSRRQRWLLGAGALGLGVLLSAGAVDLAVRALNSQRSGERTTAQRALDAIASPEATLGRLVPAAADASGSGGPHGAAVLADGHAWLVVEGLPALSPGQRYVAWHIDAASQPTAVADFHVAYAGATSVDLGKAPTGATGATGTTYAVTVEAMGPLLPSRPSGQFALQPAPAGS